MTTINELQIEYLRTSEVKDYKRQLRKPKFKQIEKTIHLIRECGIAQPIVIDKDNHVIIGWHFVEAARQMEIDTIPTVRVNHLSEGQVNLLRIAYERIAEDAEWDKEALKLELEELELLLPELDLTLTGFEVGEIDVILNLNDGSPEEDEIPDDKDVEAKVEPGELWVLGDHLLYCGDALEADSYEALLGSEKAQMVFVDAPYNLKIDGCVGNSGKIKHDEFEMASGEMSKEQFTHFLTVSHTRMAEHCEDGAILFSCMDWRHMEELLSAANTSKLSLKNLCVWAKDNGGMGSLYRSQHELVFVFKRGNKPHINNVELGKNGRYRTNVWSYPGVNGASKERREELKLHPTVKPVEMVADAILDCSKSKGLILDVFGGSGTTLLAAEKTKRHARLIEISPHYCDVTIARWEKMTGKTAYKVDLDAQQTEQKEV